MTYNTDLSEFKQYRGSVGAPVETDLAVLLHKISTLLNTSPIGDPASETTLQSLLDEIIALQVIQQNSTTQNTADIDAVNSTIESLKTYLSTIQLNTANISALVGLGANTKEATQLSHTTLLTTISGLITTLNGLVEDVRDNTTSLNDSITVVSEGQATEAKQDTIITRINSINPLIDTLESTLNSIKVDTSDIGDLTDSLNDAVTLISGKIDNLNTSVGSGLSAQLTTISNRLTGPAINSKVDLNDADPITNTFLDNIQDIQIEIQKLDNIICLLQAIKDCTCSRVAYVPCGDDDTVPGGGGGGTIDITPIVTVLNTISTTDTTIKNTVQSVLTELQTGGTISTTAIETSLETLITKVTDILTQLQDCCVGGGTTDVTGIEIRLDTISATVEDILAYIAPAQDQYGGIVGILPTYIAYENTGETTMNVSSPSGARWVYIAITEGTATIMGVSGSAGKVVEFPCCFGVAYNSIPVVVGANSTVEIRSIPWST
jgi:hypothetical protein